MYHGNDFSNEHSCDKINESVNVPISLYKSLQGKYFVGQTEELRVWNGSNAWAGLFNPHNSCVNLYANVVTISNFSD